MGDKNLRDKAVEHLMGKYKKLNFYERFGACEDPDGKIMRKVLRKTSLNGRVVLDLGAGTGRFTIPMARKAKFVYALDVLKPNLEFLMKRARKAKLKNIKTLKAGFGKIPLPDSSVDLVTSFWAFPYHSDNWDRDIKEMKRVLRPGGRIIIMDTHPHGAEFQRLWKIFTPHYHKMAIKRHKSMLKKGFSTDSLVITLDFKNEKGIRELCGGFFGPDYVGYLLGTGKTKIKDTMAFYYKRKA